MLGAFEPESVTFFLATDRRKGHHVFVERQRKESVFGGFVFFEAISTIDMAFVRKEMSCDEWWRGCVFSLVFLLLN